uniref:Uncharacterized protein n=1 Tax=Octopus bimaculoides TaxID=37653 RepID=A0A0L8GNW5_OCTBM
MVVCVHVRVCVCVCVLFDGFHPLLVDHCSNLLAIILQSHIQSKLEVFKTLEERDNSCSKCYVYLLIPRITIQKCLE